MSRLDAALEYAALGWPILPTGGDDGKKPLIPHGLTNASADPDQVRRWWTRWPDANIAIATGAPGPDVLDIDNPGAADDRALDMPGVATVATQRGLHRYFMGTDQRTIKLPYGELRRRGSYVIAPPSVRPDTGYVYSWVTAQPIGGYAPDWIAAGRSTAGVGNAPSVVNVAPGDMYDHLLDLSVRLARAGMLDGAQRERILDDEFERVQIPGAVYGGSPEDTRRLAYAATEILEREATKRDALQPSTLGIEQLDTSIQVLLGNKALSQLVLHTSGELKKKRVMTDWLVPGVVAKRWAILITGREKSAGKGTLVTYLLSRIARGRPTVFGPAAKPISAMVVSEEPEDTLQEKHVRFDMLDDTTIVYGHELGRLHLEWPDTVKLLVDTAVAKGHGILYLDNISRTARAENDDESGTSFARKVELLADVAKDSGLTLIVDHHNRKSGGRIEDRFRGGTALPGAMDNHINIEHVGGWVDRRRKLNSRGRVSATMWEKIIELNEAGTDYVTVDTMPELTVLLEQETWTLKQLMTAADITRNTARDRLNEYGKKTGKEGSEDVWTVKHAQIRRAIESEPSI